jgi:hypothetical protein
MAIGADARAAALARLASAAIDREIVLEITRTSLGRREIPQRRAACCKRSLERPRTAAAIASQRLAEIAPALRAGWTRASKRASLA